MTTGGVPVNVAAFVGMVAVVATVFLIIFLEAISKKAHAEPEELATKKPHVHDCAKHGHAKRYLVLKKLTLIKPWSCGTQGHSPTHPEGTVLWYMKWKCGSCPEFGMECRGNLGDWKIEHEQLVFDEKAFSNFEYPDPPKKSVLQPGDLEESALVSLEEYVKVTPGVAFNAQNVLPPMINEIRRRRKEAGL